ncbi:MAG: TonB-dependent receptor [Rhodobacteraceae bacterium]|nr:TonB-dependent receptor [Paracoccaceae bacterium]
MSSFKIMENRNIRAARHVGLVQVLMMGTALHALVLTDAPAVAQTAAETGICVATDCTTHTRGKAIDNSASGNLPIGKNTERETLADQGTIPFSISVDGQVVDESGELRPPAFGSPEGAKSVDRQRKTDLDLSAVDIQVKFDGLDQKTMLNVSTTPIRRAYRPGEQVRFLATANYPAFIQRAEIRIQALRQIGAQKHVDAIPVQVNGEASWTVPDGDERDFSYVLRVYDAKGRYDETSPLTITRSEAGFKPAAEQPAVAPGMAEDRTEVKNIPVYGGAVTVYGRNVPPGYDIVAFGERIPVDPDRAFVAQRILPPGQRDVDVAVEGPSKSGGLSFSRSVDIPENDWFYVAMADLTVGRRSGDKAIETVRSGEYDSVYNKGRLAFYLKGKIKGKYILTAAADTGEDELKNMFRGFDAKDPRQVLRRIDPEEYYPVYGDDSSIVDDAPSQGKFYVRLDHGNSHVMWGDYKTGITGSEFIRSNRSLYGANAVYRSEAVTSRGDLRTEATAYASQPDTQVQHDQFLATGGSAYFLKRQDLTVGSETLTVEIRDRTTGQVIERQYLREGEDYTVNYMQGLVILNQPLSTSTVTTNAVRDGALGGYNVYLVAQYEYTPTLDEVNGFAHGGRVQHWLTDNVRVGVSEMTDKSGEADQTAYGVDLELRPTDTSFLGFEIARSNGPGFGSSVSTDGGLTISDETSSPPQNKTANAYRVNGQLDLEDLSLPGLTGTIDGYYENKEAGFATLTEELLTGRTIWGAHADLGFSDDLGLRFGYDDLRDGDGQIKRDADAEIRWDLNDRWRVALGGSFKEVYSPSAIAAGKSGYDGSRVDGGARVDYRPDDDHLLYVFGQATLGRSGDIDNNNRGGIGVEATITEKIKASAEISYGTHGLGALAALSYSPTADDRYYLGYRLDPNRSFDLETGEIPYGTDKGAIVVGLRRKVNDTTSVYAEDNYDMFGRRHSLAQTYGVVYTPDADWTMEGSFEAGFIQDDTIDGGTGLERSDYDRYAGSMGVGYYNEETGVRGRIRGEGRFERSDDGTRNRNTYLLSSGLSWNTDKDWRMIAAVDTVLSDDGDGSFLDGNYVEASLGYAYRPIDNDRLNALFRSSFLYDLPGENQVSAVSGTENGYSQRSYILSADVAYDLYPWLTLGSKYGFRIGEVKQEGVSEWTSSSAHLLTTRADMHFIKNWDVLIEGRVLASPSAETTDFGALTAVYRHVGENFKVGLGYNFGSFSDDLRDQTLNDRGVFLNVVGKY